MVIYIVIFILIILLVMPINFRVTYDDMKSNVEIKLIKLFNIRLDIDEFVRFLLTVRGKRDKITFESILYNLGIFLRSRRILRWVCKVSDVRKVTMIIYEDYELISLFVFSWTVLSRLKDFLHTFFYRVHDEYYMVRDKDKIKVQMDIIIQSRIIFAIVAILFNIKDVFKILKFMKVYYGKSNI